MDPIEESCLKDIVRRHRIVYEVWPELSYMTGHQVQVGFELELYGVHEHPEGAVPGCPECQRTFRDLRRLAGAIMPAEGRPTDYKLQPFDRSFHLSPERKFANEVRLTMRIQHRHDYQDPVDDCERRCLAEMRDRLERLGVPYKRRR